MIIKVLNYNINKLLNCCFNNYVPKYIHCICYTFIDMYILLYINILFYFDFLLYRNDKSLFAIAVASPLASHECRLVRYRFNIIV